MPGDRDALIIPANPNVGAIAVTEFERLMLVQFERSGDSDARADLVGRWICDAVEAAGSPEPEISVQRDPGPRLPVVTQVTFEGANRALRPTECPGKHLVMVEEVCIGRVEPDPAVGVQQSFPPPF